MDVVKTKSQLKHRLDGLREKGTIGFVPTMGALHPGHISLVERAASETDFVVVSIFVNPTQFNNSNDLNRYPRNLKADLEMLRKTDCQLIFAPAAEEIYPEPDTRKFNFGNLEKIMEGRHRPGHFNGVAQVVSKLFELVKPDNAYFGRKDFQQLAIIKKLVAQLELSVKIVPCPIIREGNGLAMSSRNELLTPEQRENAGLIYKTLVRAKNLTAEMTVKELKKWVTASINKNPHLDVEYFEVVDDENLLPVKTPTEKNKTVGCIAVYCGKIRLIDNIILN